jgi:hypothetical protein
MNSEINSLKQAVLRPPLEAPGIEPLTSILNGFFALQAVEAETALLHCSEDAAAPEQQRLGALQSLDEINATRLNVSARRTHLDWAEAFS